MKPIAIRALSPERTICEKIMSLVRFSYEANPIEVLKLKVRHVYDLHKLLQEESLREFFNTEYFDVMLNRVAQDDVQSFRNNNSWLHHHPSESLFFNRLEEVWANLEATYSGSFAAMVYGDLPPLHNVFQTLGQIKKRIRKVEWLVETRGDANS